VGRRGCSLIVTPGGRPAPWVGGAARRGSGGDGRADADLGLYSERGNALPARREARPGLGRAVAVDAAAGQGAVAVRGDRGAPRPGPASGHGECFSCCPASFHELLWWRCQRPLPAVTATGSLPLVRMVPVSGS